MITSWRSVPQPYQMYLEAVLSSVIAATKSPSGQQGDVGAAR
jgi:hypothetical protein